MIYIILERKKQERIAPFLPMPEGRGISAHFGEDRPEAKLTNEQARYIRENPDSLSTVQLAEKFRVEKSTISLIQLGKSYKNAGGSVRDKIDTRLPDDIRNQIRAEYKKGVLGCGAHALGRKYGVTHGTILRIISESDAQSD